LLTRLQQKRWLLFLWKKQGKPSKDEPIFEIKQERNKLRLKPARLSLSPQRQTTTTVPLDKDLMTHEQALKILARALESLCKPGLEKLELQRFRILMTAVQTYNSVLEKFERWSGARD